MRFLLLFSLLIETAFAAGGSDHHFSPSTLIWPFANLLALITVLIYLTKNSMSEFFTNNSNEIKSKVETAKIKALEVQKLLDEQKKKVAGLNAEIKSIEDSASDDIKKFKALYAKETEDKMTKLKSDAAAKIEAEKVRLLSSVNETVIDGVIAKAKEKINSNPNLNTQATNKLLEGIK